MAVVSAIKGELGDLALTDWLGILGVGLALFGAVTNFIFKLRADRRAQREHLARMGG